VDAGPDAASPVRRAERGLDRPPTRRLGKAPARSSASSAGVLGEGAPSPRLSPGGGVDGDWTRARALAET